MNHISSKNFDRDEYESSLTKALNKTSNQDDDKKVAIAVLNQVLDCYPYLQRMKGVMYQMGALFQNLGSK